MRKSRYIKKCKKGCKLSKYQMGGPLEGKYGQIGSTVGNIAGMALSAAGVPGLGNILSQLYGTIGSKIDASASMNNQINQLHQNFDPYKQFQLGGQLTGNHDASLYKGKLHRNGGIKVTKNGVPTNAKNATVEVEGEETRVNIKGKEYIFSNTLTIK